MLQQVELIIAKINLQSWQASTSRIDLKMVTVDVQDENNQPIGAAQIESNQQLWDTI
jgi:hypothetical protein